MSTESEQLEPAQIRIVRSYSFQERTNALALYDATGNLERTAETLGIPKSTIHGWLNDPELQSTLRTQKTLELGQKFENAANLFLDLAVKKSKKAAFNHLIAGAGIAFDKMQISRGLPTSIHADVERQELCVILESALADEAPGHNDYIDVKPVDTTT